MGERVVRRAAVIEGAREAQALVATLGAAVRAARKARRWTLEALGRRVGVSRARLSQIERGDGAGTPLQTWIALGIALGRPLAAGFSKPLGEARLPVDAGHLEMQEHLLRLARATGRPGNFELPTRPTDPARSTDVGLRDDRNRVLIQVECWNTFGDLGAAIRATNRKAAEAAAYAIATSLGDAEPYRVATVWIVRASAGNRALVARYPNIIDAAFRGSSRLWCRALAEGRTPPNELGIVWFEPVTRRLTEHRRAR